MAGPVPAIHVFALGSKQNVDARNKCGHDELEPEKMTPIPLGEPLG
jgi:hypothetical protein